MPLAVVLVAGFFLQQIQVESQEEEEAQGSGCLPGAESPQAARAPLLLLAAAEEVCLREELLSVEKPQPLPGGLLKLHPQPSRNTSAGVAGR